MLTPKFICDELSDLDILRKSLVAVDYFSCLYDRYEKQLLRYVKRVAFATDEEAADILQEAFIKIWRNLNAFDQRLKLSSWLYRIVHNEAISFVRKKKSYGKDLRVSWDENLYAEIPDEPGAADELENRDKLTHRLLAQLPESYREVLVLKFLENMGYEEISDILKIPEGTVATRINRAKKAFRNLAEQS
jgi:RNA polymerase sigma-70 factor (ECF subfamily)